MTRYWFRFDDLCPTMDRRKWERVEQMLDAHGVRPLLAIVPDNQDPKLDIDPPDPSFWECMRKQQARGSIIGLHGYRHVYDSRAPSLLPFKPISEFSGHTREVQAQRIRSGLETLRGHGLTPRVWVAPGHAFDETTLEVLSDAGLRVVSDGFGFRPYLDARGLTWIPQQIRRLRTFPFGTITVALHTNEMNERDFVRLEQFISAHRNRQAPSFDVLIQNAVEQRWTDRLWERTLLSLFRFKWRRRVRGA